jgi:hypothetical protein
LETGSCKLFAQAGLKPQSSWSSPTSSYDYRREPPAPSEAK